jgi:hypothetical protein
VFHIPERGDHSRAVLLPRPARLPRKSLLRGRDAELTLLLSHAFSHLS